MKKLSLFVGVMAFVFAATAVAQTVPVADRPLVVKAGGGEVGLDIGIGLDKGAMAKRIGLWNADQFDPYSGLSFEYGVMDKLGVGLAARLGWADGPGFKFYGAKLYAKYAFIDMLAAELGILLPGEKFGDQRMAVDIGIPFQYVAMPGMLKIHARPDVILDFKKKELQGGKAVAMRLLFSAGATFNATPELFFDLTGGVSKGLSPSSPITIPVTLTAGYTVMPAMDVYLAFGLLNVKEKAFDFKAVTLGANYRF